MVYYHTVNKYYEYIYISCRVFFFFCLILWSWNLERKKIKIRVHLPVLTEKPTSEEVFTSRSMRQVNINGYFSFLVTVERHVLVTVATALTCYCTRRNRIWEGLIFVSPQKKILRKFSTPQISRKFFVPPPQKKKKKKNPPKYVRQYQ